MKFCFGFFPYSTFIYHKIAEELVRRFPDSSFSGYVIGRRWERYLRSTGLPYDRLEVITEYIADHWDSYEPDIDYLRSMEQQYGIPHLWHFVSADRYICRYPYKDILKMLEAHFRLFNQFFADNRPDVIISPSPAGMSSYIAYAIARELGIPYCGLGIGPLPGTVRFINPDGSVQGLQERYDEYRNRPLSLEERNRAEKFLTEFRGKSMRFRFVSPDIANFLKPPHLLFNPLNLIRHIINYYIVERGRDFSMPTVGTMIVDKLARVTRRILIQTIQTFDFPKEGESFVLFPFQIDPEATTLVHGPFYIDQAALAENIARSLPVGYKLYVKEHPMVSYGYKPFRTYRRLRNIPNIRLIAPHVDSHELIRHSAAVVVVHGTVGWEAILYEKPVVVLGQSFLKDFEGACFVGALAELPGVLRRVIMTFHSDHDRLLRYVLAVLDCAYLGSLDFLDNNADPDNARLLTDAVVQKIGLVSS